MLQREFPACPAFFSLSYLLSVCEKLQIFDRLAWLTTSEHSGGLTMTSRFSSARPPSKREFPFQLPAKSDPLLRLQHLK